MVPHTEPGLPFPDFLSQTLIRRELYPVVFKYCGVCGIVDVKEDRFRVECAGISAEHGSGGFRIASAGVSSRGRVPPCSSAPPDKRAVVFGEERRPLIEPRGIFLKNPACVRNRFFHKGEEAGLFSHELDILAPVVFRERSFVVFKFAEIHALANVAGLVDMQSEQLLQICRSGFHAVFSEFVHTVQSALSQNLPPVPPVFVQKPADCVRKMFYLRQDDKFVCGKRMFRDKRKRQNVRMDSVFVQCLIYAHDRMKIRVVVAIFRNESREAIRQDGDVAFRAGGRPGCCPENARISRMVLLMIPYASPGFPLHGRIEGWLSSPISDCRQRK